MADRKAPDDPRKASTDFLARRNRPLLGPRGTDKIGLDAPYEFHFALQKTSDVLKVKVLPYMIVGRKVTKSGNPVHIDLDPFDGQKNGVSRRHATIQVEGKQVKITDYNSANGTFLNDKRLIPLHDYPLYHTDKLGFGELEMHIYFVTPTSWA